MPTYSGTALDKATELTTALNQIDWPGEAAYNFYPGRNGHPDITDTVTWGTPGTPTSYLSKAQCAPFVTACLKSGYGADWATAAYFTANLASSSPTSAQYYDKISADTLPHFDKRTRLSELVAGDLIVIKYLSNDSANGDPTGHSAFYVSHEAVDKDNDAATAEWAVTVVDSTSNPHGVASTSSGSTYLNYPDTRAVGTTEYDGAGKGTMVFRTDAAGAVLGYWWGINENVTTGWHPVGSRPVVFGHITQNA